MFWSVDKKTGNEVEEINFLEVGKGSISRYQQQKNLRIMSGPFQVSNSVR